MRGSSDNIEDDYVDGDDESDDDYADYGNEKNLREMRWSSDNRHGKPLLWVEVGRKLPHLFHHNYHDDQNTDGGDEVLDQNDSTWRLLSWLEV